MKAAGHWMADYGRIYKNKEGVRAVCSGFSRGQSGTFTRLKRLDASREELECEFVTSHTPELEDDVDWYATNEWMHYEAQLQFYANNDAIIKERGDRIHAALSRIDTRIVTLEAIEIISDGLLVGYLRVMRDMLQRGDLESYARLLAMFEDYIKDYKLELTWKSDLEL
jgi:hypothetical protein